MLWDGNSPSQSVGLTGVVAQILSLQSKSKCQLEGLRSSDSETGASQSPALYHCVHETAPTSLRPPTMHGRCAFYISKFTE